MEGAGDAVTGQLMEETIVGYCIYTAFEKSCTAKATCFPLSKDIRRSLVVV